MMSAVGTSVVWQKEGKGRSLCCLCPPLPHICYSARPKGAEPPNQHAPALDLNLRLTSTPHLHPLISTPSHRPSAKPKGLDPKPQRVPALALNPHLTSTLPLPPLSPPNDRPSARPKGLDPNSRTKACATRSPKPVFWKP